MATGKKGAARRRTVRKKSRATAARPTARPATPTRPAPVATVSGVAPGMQPVSAFLAVANVSASTEFIERVLGFSRGVTLGDPDGQLRYAELRRGDTAVVLVRKGDESTPSNGAAALYTYVEDVDAAAAAARNAGAGVGDTLDRPWGDRTATIVDPDGYRWVLATFKKLVPFA
jgi:uncharacterized glyoxalase superfamily protein PhnB